MITRKKGRIGSRFDDFLREEGIYESVQAIAIKRVIAWQLAEAMKVNGVTKAEMARRMNISRSQLDRLLIRRMKASSCKPWRVPRKSWAAN